MKRLILFTLMFFYCAIGQSQIIRAIDFYVDLGSGSFPRTYNEMATLFDDLTLDIRNNTNSAQDIYITVVIYKDGEWFARTKMNYRGIALTLGAYEDKILRKPEFEALDIMISEGDVEFVNGFNITDNIFTTVLPEGMYTICPIAFDAKTMPEEFQISDAYPITCGDMYLVAHNVQALPLLPIHEQCISVTDIGEPIEFSWVLLSADPMTQDAASYSLKIIDITNLPANTVDQIFSDGTPVSIEVPIPAQTTNGNYQLFPDLYNMEAGHAYAWRLDVEIPGLEENEENVTSTEIYTFKYGGCFEGEEWEGGDEDEELDDCQCALNQIPTDENPKTEDINSFKAGLFNVVSDVQSGGINNNNGTYSGHGLIQIGFLNNVKIKVSLNDVKVNEDGRMYEGFLSCKSEENFNIEQYIQEVGTQYGLGPYTSTAYAMIPEKQKIAEFTNALVTTGALLKDIADGAERGMPLGIEQNIQGMNIVLGITDIHFEPTKSYYHVIINIPFEFNNELLYISLGGWVCGGPNGFSNDVILHMIKDFRLDETYGIDPNTEPVFVFKGQEASSGASFDLSDPNFTYLEFSCQGLKSGKLIGNVELPSDYFAPEDADGNIAEGKAIVSFSGSFGTPDSESIPENTIVDGLQWKANLQTETAIQFKKLKGWAFEIVNAELDMTELSNPSNFTPPTLSDGNEYLSDFAENPNLWKGFYLKEANLKIPNNFAAENATRTSVAVSDMIIDPEFSAKIFSKDILALKDGDLSGWYFSIDTIDLEIVKNDLRKGKLSGQLGAPFFQDDDNPEENETLQYSALLQANSDNNDEFGYVFNVRPKDDITMPMWLADVNLDGSSTLHVTYNQTQSAHESKWNIDANLLGNIEISTDKLPDNTVTSLIPDLNISLLAFDLKYNSTDGFTNESTFSHIGGQVIQAYGYSDEFNHKGSMASVSTWQRTNLQSVFDNNYLLSNNPKQGTVQGFDFTIEKIGLDFGGSTSGFAPGLKIKPRVSLVGDNTGFSATTEVVITTKIDVGERNISFDGVRLNALRIYTETNGFFLDGSLEIFKNDATWGNGFKGSLGVGMPCGISAYLAGGFGRKGDVNDKYTWWYAEGLVNFGVTGINMGPMSMYGLGGGIYYNIKPGQMDIKTIVEQFKEEDDEKFTPPSGEERLINSNQEPPPAKTNIPEIPKPNATHSPEEGKYAFNLVTVIGLAGEPSTFNMDVLLGATFQANKGVTEIKVNGDAYFMTPMRQREDNPKVKISVKNKISFPPSGGYVYQGNMDVFVDLNYNIVSIKGAQPNNNKMVSACMQFGSASDDWYLYVGNPYNETLPLNPRNGELSMPTGRGSLKVKTFLPNHEITADGYFLLGNRLPTYLPEIDKDIAAMIGKVTDSGKNSLTGDVKSIGQRNRVGTGIGFGTTIGFKSANEFVVIGHDLTVKAGFDLLLNNNTGPCGSNNNPGLNGYYGNGQVFAGFDGRLYINNFFPFGPNKINIIAATAVAEVVGGGPNPWWVRGGAGVSYEVLGGLIEGEDYFEFALGDVCIPPKEDPFGIDVIASINPSNLTQEISPFVNPSVEFNLPIQRTFEFEELYKEGNQMKTRNVKLKPVITKLELKQGNENLTVSTFWKNDNTVMHIKPVTSLPLGKTMTLKFTVQAECINCPSQQSGKYWKKNTSEWKKDTIITFTIANRVPNAHEIVKATLPIHGRRYEYPASYSHIGYFGIELSTAINEDILKPEGSDATWIYSYKADIIDPVGNKIVSSVPFELSADRKRITFDKFGLLPNKKYMVRLARKQTLRNLGTDIPNNLNPQITQLMVRINNSVYNYSGLDNVVGNTDFQRIVGEMSRRKRRIAINNDSGSGGQDPLDSFDDKVQQEIATYFFETSKYNSFEEKIENAVYYVNLNNDLRISLREPMDIIEAGKGIDLLRKRFRDYNETLLYNFIPRWEHNLDAELFKQFNEVYFSSSSGVDVSMMEQTIKAFNTIDLGNIDFKIFGVNGTHHEGELRKFGQYPSFKVYVLATLSHPINIPKVSTSAYSTSSGWATINNELEGEFSLIHDDNTIGQSNIAGINIGIITGLGQPNNNSIYKLYFNPKAGVQEKYSKVREYILGIKNFDLDNFSFGGLTIISSPTFLDAFFKEKLNSNHYITFRNRAIDVDYFNSNFGRGRRWNFDIRTRIPMGSQSMVTKSFTF